MTEVHSKKQNEEEVASWFPVGSLRPDCAASRVPVSIYNIKSLASLLYLSIMEKAGVVFNDDKTIIALFVFV